MSTLKLKNGTTESETGKKSLKFCISTKKLPHKYLLKMVKFSNGPKLLVINPKVTESSDLRQLYLMNC